MTSRDDQVRESYHRLLYSWQGKDQGAIVDFFIIAQTTEKAASSTNWDAITAISTGLSAILTGVAAVATAIMAWLTREAIRDGQDQRKETNDHFVTTRGQDQRHHEDSFRPLLVLSPSNGSDIAHREDMLTLSEVDGPLPRVNLICSLENIGSGAALNIRLYARSNGTCGFGPSTEMAPLAANGSYKNASGIVQIPVHFHSSFNKQDLYGLRSGSWILALEYDDVFGNTFHTLHYKSPLEPWARTDRGPAPDTTPKNITLPLEG